MLLAEDLLLLLTDDDSGRLAAPSSEVDVALGGALLVELTLMRRVDVAGSDERVREGRLMVRDADATGDDLLECKNFGVTSLNEVREKLEQHGLKLRGD